MTTSEIDRATASESACELSREQQRLQLQRDLDSRRDLRSRNKWGQFATPSDLALEIAQMARRRWRGREPVRFLEPALGTGAFYLALRRAFADVSIDRALGFERDPVIAAAAKNLWSGTTLCVESGDFLRARPPAPGRRFNLILANPPYVRHHHIDVNDKNYLKSAPPLNGHRISGLASLYVYFVLAADAWLTEGGLAIWLLPHEFLDVNYGSCLREYLAGDVALRALHRFPPQGCRFPDALVTSCVLTYEKPPTQPAARDHALFSTGEQLSTEGSSSRWIAPGELEREARWTRLFASDPLDSPSETTEPEPTLGDFFSVRRGIATGANDFFILTKAHALAAGFPEEVLRPILPSPRLLSEPVIGAESDGAPRLARSLYVIDCDLDEGEVRARWPTLARYLEHGRTLGVHRRYLPRHRSPWYSQERREPAPFVCSYMGRPSRAREMRPIRFFWNRSRAITANVYLMLYPKPQLARLLAEDDTLAMQVLQTLEDISSSSLLRHGRVYGGGLYKLEPRELRELPAPKLAQLVTAKAMRG